MAKRPLARRHLARLHDLTTTSSVCRVAEERGLLDSPLVARGAAEDRSIAEECVSLARERGWSLPDPKPYAWKLMASYSDPRPRMHRILSRDQFELDGIYRETDDDDVGSLACRLRDGRSHLSRELAQERPDVPLPGAK